GRSPRVTEDVSSGGIYIPTGYVPDAAGALGSLKKFRRRHKIEWTLSGQGGILWASKRPPLQPLRQERVMPYAYRIRLPAESVQSERAAFIRRTYAHVAGSVLALVALEAILLQIVPGETIENIFLRGNWTWLLVMLAWMAASYVARLWANSATSTAMQYM